MRVGKLTWEEPPQQYGKRLSKFDIMVAILKNNPERWARLKAYKVGSNAYKVATRLNARHPDCEFRIVHGVLYGRYLNGAKDTD